MKVEYCNHSLKKGEVIVTMMDDGTLIRGKKSIKNLDFDHVIAIEKFKQMAEPFVVSACDPETSTLHLTNRQTAKRNGWVIVNSIWTDEEVQALAKNREKKWRHKKGCKWRYSIQPYRIGGYSIRVVCDSPNGEYSNAIEALEAAKVEIENKS